MPSPPPFPLDYALPSSDTDRGNVGLAFGLVVAAGGATCIGAGLAFIVKQTNHAFMAAALGFSAGVMLYVSFVEIFTLKAVEGFEQAGYPPNKAYQYATLSFFGGMLMTWLLDLICHGLIRLQEYMQARREMRQGGVKSSAKGLTLSSASTRSEADLEMATAAGTRTMGTSAAPAGGLLADPSGATSGVVANVLLQLDTAGAQPRQNSNHQRLHHHSVLGRHSIEAVCAATQEYRVEDDVERTEAQAPQGVSDGIAQIIANDNHFSLKKMGLLTVLAITMHNVPEGLATYIGTLADPTAGVAIAVAIALHNIPEGIVIAMPIFLATGSKWKAFFWASMSGLAEPIGGLIGYLALQGSDLDPLAYALLFGIVAGMMTWISVRELIPTALRYDPQDRFATLGVFAGFVVMAISLILFTV
ncbi:hypothetical protein FOA52_002839 [Chlamydomonas sp. UWO 241]|nr:hypothetical protein FOA52_002839 [Chlamydomonas sp. UWO 241]